MTNVTRFWREQKARYNLMGSKCTHCDALIFPPKETCPECKHYVLEPHKFNPTGSIQSYTIVHVPQEGFDLQIPYALAIIQLDDGPCLTAQIVDADLEKIKIGTRVTAIFRRITQDGPNGAIYYGYKFKLLE